MLKLIRLEIQKCCTRRFFVYVLWFRNIFSKLSVTTLPKALGFLVEKHTFFRRNPSIYAWVTTFQKVNRKTIWSKMLMYFFQSMKTTLARWEIDVQRFDQK